MDKFLLQDTSRGDTDIYAFTFLAFKYIEELEMEETDMKFHALCVILEREHFPRALHQGHYC